jgi:hypothetical protein
MFALGCPKFGGIFVPPPGGHPPVHTRNDCASGVDPDRRHTRMGPSARWASVKAAWRSPSSF